MSGSNSRSETPTASASTSAPSPLAVGTRFVKQYYQTLSTTPEQLERFYQNDASIVSFGNGSTPSQEGAHTVQRWGVSDNHEAEASSSLRFEFKDGAIDAQRSVNGGILLVVTGHAIRTLTTPVMTNEVKLAFLHTFFLAVTNMEGGKKSYYVHNDILRFLNETNTVTTTTTAAVPVAAAKPLAVEPVTPDTMAPTSTTEPTVEEPVVVVAASITQDKLPVAETIPIAPGGGVEESKDEGTPQAEPVTPRRGPTNTHQEKPTTPGSWASLVANHATVATSTTTAPVVSKPARPAKAVVAPPKPVVAAAPPQPKRDPDWTLVIKNFDAARTTQEDIMAIFEPFATQNNGKVVGCTVSAKGVAFVDYDCLTPVLAVVETHAKVPMELHGRVLEVYQKTMERRPKKGGGGGGGPGGRGYRRSGSGGRGGRGGGTGRGAGGRS